MRRNSDSALQILQNDIISKEKKQMVEDLYRSYGFPLTASVISISFLMNSQLCATTKFIFRFLHHAF
jgi:hypothetical protein